MDTFFNQLYDYNFHCNKRLIEAFSDMETVPEKSLSLFSHILNAHHIWNARVNGRKSELEVWQVHDVSALGDIHYENQRDSFGIISKTDDFDERIDYENSEGRRLTNNLRGVLFHVINHSAHHRGQIAMDFKVNGLEPLSIDYIHYKG